MGLSVEGGGEGRRGRLAKGQEDMKGEYGKHAGQGKKKGRGREWKHTYKSRMGG